MSATLYSLVQAEKRGKVQVDKIFSPTINTTYTSMTILEIKKQQFLISYDKKQHKIDSWELLDKEPWIKESANKLELKGPAWDNIEGFTLGDQPYIKAYEAKKGEFAFFPITEDLSDKYPLHLYHPRPPNTIGLTMSKMLVNVGQLALMGYNGENGDINIWTLSVTARSDGLHPPLVTEPAFIHQWAKGWTRFAFFTFGESNFFLKTNTWKPNVNIDSLFSDLSQGTFEVGTQLNLKNAQEINLVGSVEIGETDPYPYFITYIQSSGDTTINRVHASCKAWTCEAAMTCAAGCKLLMPYQVNKQSFMLLL